MATAITEFFGFKPLDPAANQFVGRRECPFIGRACIKPTLGACTLHSPSLEPVICCPNRMYADNYRILIDVAISAFGDGVTLIDGNSVKSKVLAGELDGSEVAVFGHGRAGELQIPQPVNEDGEVSSFSIDWVLAKIDSTGKLQQFTAVEVQTIDTTNSYRKASESYFRFEEFAGYRGNNPGWTNAGFNWANVSKRILPQLIYKGYVLRREALCTKGLFFVCPTAVLKKVRARLGGRLLEYPVASGTITFRSYSLGAEGPAGTQRPLVLDDTFTTTVEQMAYAFVSPVNLPEMGVYERAIDRGLRR